MTPFRRRSPSWMSSTIFLATSSFPEGVPSNTCAYVEHTEEWVLLAYYCSTGLQPDEECQLRNRVTVYNRVTV